LLSEPTDPDLVYGYLAPARGRDISCACRVRPTRSAKSQGLTNIVATGFYKTKDVRWRTFHRLEISESNAEERMSRAFAAGYHACFGYFECHVTKIINDCGTILAFIGKTDYGQINTNL
jgi:hypothetical protein